MTHTWLEWKRSQTFLALGKHGEDSDSLWSASIWGKSLLRKVSHFVVSHWWNTCSSGFVVSPHHFGWERTKWVGRVTKWWLNVRVPPTHHLRFKIPFIKKTWLCHLLHVEITALVRFTWRPFIRYLAFHKMHLSNCLDLKLDMFEKHQTAHPRVFNPWFKNVHSWFTFSFASV